MTDLTGKGAIVTGSAQGLDCGELRHARLIERAGDLIRLLMLQQKMGAYATFSVHALPPAQTQRLGGRQASKLK